MSRIFITGSADGLGMLAARSLVAQGHQVVLHARNEARGKDALGNVPGTENVVTGDLADINETKALAEKVNTLGNFDVVIHNAGVYNVDAKTIFAVNVLAPYILTCRIQKPHRLIYLSSDMHLSGHANIMALEKKDVQLTYSDSKLYVVMLANAVARKWPGVLSNALNPGWVPTKMGGSGAPDNLQKGYETQVWLATSNDATALVSGRYFFHKHEERCHRDAGDVELQEKLMAACERLTGVAF